jgi:hypothetical protein
MTSLSNGQSRRSNATNVVFAAVYIVVGILLIYLRFTNVISTDIFGIGIFALMIGSLIFKFATDFLRRKK